MVPVYSAGRQLTKVRAVMAGSVVFLSIFLWLAWDSFQTYGLRPADGGQLASFGVRLAWGLGLTALGLAFPAGMWAYGLRYVAAIRRDESTGMVDIDTLRGLWRHTTRVPAASVHFGESHAGRLRTAKHTVKAPWTSLRVDGLAHSLILDDQGHLLDAEFPQELRRSARLSRSGQGAGPRGAA